MLKATNLTKKFNETKALDKVSFSIEKGKTTGFLGPNGAGKTTTMRILTGFLIPNSGKVQYEKDSLELARDKIITQIGYLPENNPLYDNLRVDEFLIWIARIKDAYNKRKLKDIVKKCGIEKVLNQPIETLSKGYRQRVGLAKALIGNPKYLILDEPTEGLDPNQKEEILKLIKEFSKEKTILFSSHVLSEVTQVADNIIIINKGKIVAQGDKDDLVKEYFKNAIVSVKTNAPSVKFSKELKGIKTISESQEISKAKFSEYEVLCTDPEKTALEIFNTVSKNNWKLTELHVKSQGLEELFKKLTK